MKSSRSHRFASLALLFALALILAASGVGSASRVPSNVRSASSQSQTPARLQPLKEHLSSESRATFLGALDALAALDEESAIDLWHDAISNANPQLRAIAWRQYRQVMPELLAKQS